MQYTIQLYLIYLGFIKSHFHVTVRCWARQRSKFYKLTKYVRTCHCAHLSLGSLLAVYLCISATIRSLWFPNSFFSALSRATSEALGPLLFSASCTVFREDSICWKDTRYILITFTILVPHQYSSLWSILTGSKVFIISTAMLEVSSKKPNLSRNFQGWHKLNTRVMWGETSTLLVSTKMLCYSRA